MLEVATPSCRLFFVLVSRNAASKHFFFFRASHRVPAVVDDRRLHTITVGAQNLHSAPTYGPKPRYRRYYYSRLALTAAGTVVAMVSPHRSALGTWPVRTLTRIRARPAGEPSSIERFFYASTKGRRLGRPKERTLRGPSHREVASADHQHSASTSAGAPRSEQHFARK